MTTSIGGELRRYRSLTIALIVGIIASVAAFITLLSLDMQETRRDMRTHADLFALQTEDRLTSIFEAVATEVEFLQLAGRLPSARQRLFVDRSVGDLNLDDLLEQFCILETESSNVRYRLQATMDCPTIDATAATAKPVAIPGRTGGQLLFQQAGAEAAALQMIISVDIDDARRALFSVGLSRLLAPSLQASAAPFETASFSCLYWLDREQPVWLGCSSAPEARVDVAAPTDLLVSSSMSYSHTFASNSLDWQLVTVVRGGAIATSISSFPAIALIFLLLATAGICYNIYQATEKNVQLRRRQKALQKALNELEQRNIDLEQFAYMASHDLQTPVRHVVYRATMLLEDLASGEHDAVKKNGEQLIAAGARMQALLLDLLDFCRAGESVTRIVSVDTKALVERQIAMIRDAESTLTINVDIGPLPILQTDEVKFEQILQNLLFNAVKFRRPGVTPAITVGATRDAATGSWLFEVRDNGIGIDSDNLERIFLPFKQLNQGRESSGTGVGLSIARRLVERLGGKIWAESRPLHGASFFFTLPAIYTADVEQPVTNKS